uniref:Uncharacterized protein n=1 Tax=Ditylenchus dipsaci TaxID=166011 RepID=A0A915DNB6_9BILA
MLQSQYSSNYLHHLEFCVHPGTAICLFHEKRQSSRVCGNPYSTTNFWMTYKWVEFFSFFFVPCIIFVLLYTKVSCVLWAKNKQLYEEHSFSSGELNARSDALAMRRSVVKMLGIFLSKVLFNVTFHPPYEFILLMNALALLCSACGEEELIEHVWRDEQPGEPDEVVRMLAHDGGGHMANVGILLLNRRGRTPPVQGESLCSKGHQPGGGTHNLPRPPGDSILEMLFLAAEK